MDVVSDVLGGVTGHETVIIGEGETTAMVVSDVAPDLGDCSIQEIISTKRCDELKILVIDAAKMPYIARNIQLAWSEGRNYLLHRDASKNRRAKYEASCGSRSGFVVKYPGQGSCDEFEFASTAEGGTGARTEEVPIREQNCQGATIKNAYYTTPGIAIGEEFLVLIANPASIATEPFAGLDTAKEQACGF
jgi:Deoxyribonuclease NucA/NucB